MALTGFIARLKGRSWFQVIFVRSSTAIADGGAGFFSLGTAPTSGAAGSYFGQAPKGSILSDTLNGKLYINTGTQAVPTWTVVGTQT